MIIDFKQKELPKELPKPPYEPVLRTLGKLFDQYTEDMDAALSIAGNFDTLIMFCFASKEMGIPVNEIAEMSLHTKIPQMYLKTIRHREETNGIISSGVTRLRRNCRSEQQKPETGTGGEVL
jgi:hypothetical protein